MKRPNYTNYRGGQEAGEGDDGDADSCAGHCYLLDLLLQDIARETLTPRGHRQEHVVHADS